jgi:NAD(P)-dependent dehydrogenase (short-subunit alcohol dehydrogenase family)
VSDVIVVVGAGSIGQAIARRVSPGKHVLLADLRAENAEAAAEILRDAGFEATTASVDVASRASVHALVQTATGLGPVTGSFTPPVSRPARPPRRPSFGSTCTAPPSSWRSSGMSSPPEEPGW